MVRITKTSQYYSPVVKHFHQIQADLAQLGERQTEEYTSVK